MLAQIRRVLTVFAATAALAAGGFLIAAPAANAQSCSASYSCFWDFRNHSGGDWQFAGWNDDWSDYGVNNDDQSMVNNGNTHAVVQYNFKNQNRDGWWLCTENGFGWSVYPVPENDTSSNSWQVNC